MRSDYPGYRDPGEHHEADRHCDGDGGQARVALFTRGPGGETWLLGRGARNYEPNSILPLIYTRPNASGVPRT